MSTGLKSALARAIVELDNGAGVAEMTHTAPHHSVSAWLLCKQTCERHNRAIISPQSRPILAAFKHYQGNAPYAL